MFDGTQSYSTLALWLLWCLTRSICSSNSERRKKAELLLWALECSFRDILYWQYNFLSDQNNICILDNWKKKKKKKNNGWRKNLPEKFKHGNMNIIIKSKKFEDAAQANINHHPSSLGDIGGTNFDGTPNAQWIFFLLSSSRCQKPFIHWSKWCAMSNEQQL